MTQGGYWSNQDGWQYVDSVAIPGPQPGRPPTGRRRHSNIKVSRRQAQPSADSDSRPFGASSSGNLNRARSIVPNDNSVDNSSSNGPETHPDTHPEGDNDDQPRGSRGGRDPSSMPGTNPSTDLDVDNCCGWYGVVCIGPDGKFPPHWPPYDEDLISSRFSTPDPVLSAPLEHFNKRKEPYYSYHDRQWRHHHLGGNRGGRGKDDDRDGYDGIYDGRTDDGESRTPQGPQDSPTNMPGDTTRDWGEGSKMPDIDDWYILELHLGFNGLVGPVPDVVSKLANLMILDLSNNELEGQIPESYSNLTRLERFLFSGLLLYSDIGSNKITGQFPVAVTKMINIQELVLKNNYFAGHLPPELLQLKQLTELSIANNEFDGLLPQGLFASLKKLRAINISQNGFTGEISSDVGGLTGLVKLNLGDNHLTGEIPESIYTLRNFKILDLPANKLTGKISPEIGNMAGLTKLILSHNSFNGSLPVEIQNLTRLESMVVNYNSFSGVFPVARAPPLMTLCLVQPNAFQGCPPNASVENSTTLAYQCNLDCSDRVLHPDIYEAISCSSPIYDGTILGRILFITIAAIVFGTIF
ncbi:hypothetical protein BGZ74_007609 [Mortierella antarctica]|nr:hypothetical protein BGZ74_007609 [Mortierella antarctica]